MNRRVVCFGDHDPLHPECMACSASEHCRHVKEELDRDLQYELELEEWKKGGSWHESQWQTSDLY